MTPEVPITRRESRLLDGSENDTQHTSSLPRQNSVDASVEVDESDTTFITESHKSWTLDDIEGVVMDVLDDIVIGSAELAMETVVTRRLIGYVAAWGSAIIQETLASAIAPTGDICVDSSDLDVLNCSRALLGRSNLPLETLDPPKSCPVDDSYQPRQVPIRMAKRNQYDSEELHHAVKAATRSHAHPASVTSSRVTTSSKVRKKQQGATTVHVKLTGPQPGVPYSTESHHPHTGKHHIVSLRTAKATNHPEDTNDRIDSVHDTLAGASLQLDIDNSESTCQGDSIESVRARQSPPTSVASSRRRPHPPGSAQNGRVTKTLCFGERDEEIKVEFAVQNTPPRRNSVNSKPFLPEIDGRRITQRQSLPYPAFGVFGGANGNVSNDERDKEPPFHEDQNFHAMTLSPGVKVRAGEESNAGPDLPSFASRMRRSTFARMETCTQSASISNPLSPRVMDQSNHYQVQQPGKGTFLTEAAWNLGQSTTASNVPGDQAIARGRSNYPVSDCRSKSDDISSTEPAASCSCSSSTSLTLFRRQSKVQRPCLSCSNPKAVSTRTDTMNFSNLVKQRAFHMKPPCLPATSSPSKRAPGASPRRVTSAPVSSPLARRNLLQSKKPAQPRHKDLDNTTQII